MLVVCFYNRHITTWAIFRQLHEPDAIESDSEGDDDSGGGSDQVGHGLFQLFKPYAPPKVIE